MTIKKNVPLISLRDAYLAQKADFDAAAARVLDSGWYLLGKEVDAFEAEFAAWSGTNHCVSLANGTDAIVVAIRSLGVGAGDTVFTASHTAVATVAAIELAGAVPMLVDVDEASFTLDPAKLEAAIAVSRASGARPRAVVAVHLYGHPCDLDALADICRRHDLILIEDCAQSHGATWGGRKLGTFGAAAGFSFYPTKNLGAFGDGGAMVTGDAKTDSHARALRQYGWRERYISDEAGFNSRLDELQAALLRVKLVRLDADIAARRRIAATYNDALANMVNTPTVREGADHAWHLYVVPVPQRDRFAAALKERGVGTALHYPQPVHRQKAYAGRVATGDLSVTEKLATDILSLPMHPHLGDEDVAHVIDSVRAVAREVS